MAVLWGKYVELFTKNVILSNKLTRCGLDMYYLKEDMLKMQCRHRLHIEAMSERIDCLTQQVVMYKELYRKASIRGIKINDLLIENVRLKDELNMYKAYEGKEKLVDNVTPVESPLYYKSLGSKNTLFLPPKH